ncbi:unnamed protein product [marine sediment metagenome]|uniref:DUF551 domain-containing protein n=1 Tax=marine sediment metagenome TaxID=412755 RepID=X0Y4U8_9ZZZZ
MDWIDIRIALPHPQLWVLAVQKSGQMTVMFMHYLDGRLEWADEELRKNTGIDANDQVMFWRELPKPPMME